MWCRGYFERSHIKNGGVGFSKWRERKCWQQGWCGDSFAGRWQQGRIEKEYRQFGNFCNSFNTPTAATVYWHPQQNGVVVNVGDTVKQGRWIGISGNTGLYSFSASAFHLCGNRYRALVATKCHRFQTQRESAIFVPEMVQTETIQLKQNQMNEIWQQFIEGMKATTLLEYIAVLPVIARCVYSHRKKIFSFAGWVSEWLLCTLSAKGHLFWRSECNFYTVMSLYGWYLGWKKIKEDALVCTSLSPDANGWLACQLLFLLRFYVVIALNLKQNFAPGAIPGPMLFAGSTAFTGMWLMTKKWKAGTGGLPRTLLPFRFAL